MTDRDPRQDPQIGGDVVGNRTIIDRRYEYVDNKQIEVVEWRKIRKEAGEWKGEDCYGEMRLGSWRRWAKDKPVLRVATDEEITDMTLGRIGLGKHPVHITRELLPPRRISRNLSDGDYNGSCHPGSGNAF